MPEAPKRPAFPVPNPAPLPPRSIKSEFTLTWIRLVERRSLTGETEELGSGVDLGDGQDDEEDDHLRQRDSEEIALVVSVNGIRSVINLRISLLL